MAAPYSRSSWSVAKPRTPLRDLTPGRRRGCDAVPKTADLSVRSSHRDISGSPEWNSALSYSVLRDLCDQQFGVRDVTCLLCGPGRRASANRKRKVLRIWHEPGFATFHCIRCGARGWARADADNASPHHDRGTEDLDQAIRQCGKARWLWSRRVAIAHTPAETYLCDSRGYGEDLPATMGFLPASKTEHHPALISVFGVPHELEPGLIQIKANQVHGVHLILLRPDGSGKAGTGRDKFMVGPSSGWPIVIAPPNDLLSLAITEGIEDALSVRQATGIGVWAAGSASRVPKLAERFSHDDEAGQLGARKLAEGLVLRGFEVRVEGLLR